MSKNNIGYVFSYKIVFMWVLSRPCFQGKLATISYKTSTQKKKFFKMKNMAMLFFNICETPENGSNLPCNVLTQEFVKVNMNIC